MGVWEQEEKKKAEKLIDKPMYNIPQTVQIYKNKHAGILYYILTVIFLIMAAGSIGIIPFAVKWGNLGLITVILTITFWIGFVGSILFVVGINAYAREVYLLTDQKLLYRVYFSPREYGSGERAYTELGQFIQNVQIINERSKAHEVQREYLSSEHFKRTVTEAVNGNETLVRGCVLCKLNSACIAKRLLDGVMIRYWDEDAFRWQEAKLRKSNEGYAIIVGLLKGRPRK